MKESDLAAQVIEYLGQDYEIFKEVPWGGIIDIYAVAGGITTAIECKTSFSFDVIAQARKNRNWAHMSYVAVPKGKNQHFQKEVCKTYGIGVIIVCSQYGFTQVSEAVKPAINRSILKPPLKEWMKNSIAGVKSEGRITVFKDAVSQIEKEIIKSGGTLSANELFSRDKYHWGSTTSAIQCVRNMCNKGVIKQFEFKKGQLILKLAA